MPNAPEQQKLTPSDRRILRNAVAEVVLAEFGEEKPTEQEFSEWIQAKSLKHGVPAKEIKHILKDRQVHVEFCFNSQLAFQAEKIATAAGATLAKAMHRIAEAMDATKRIVKYDRKGEVLIDEEVPDWDTRLRACEDVFKIRAAYAPQQIEVEHGVTDQLAQLTQDQLEVRKAELIAEFIATQKQQRKQLQEGKPN